MVMITVEDPFMVELIKNEYIEKSRFPEIDRDDPNLWNESFHEFCHMEVRTYQHIKTSIMHYNHYIASGDIVDFVTLDKQLIVTFYIIAQGESFASVEDLFDMRPDAIEICFEKTLNVLSHLWLQNTKWPRPDELTKKRRNFQNRYGIVNCVGVKHTLFTECILSECMNTCISREGTNVYFKKQVAIEMLFDSSHKIISLHCPYTNYSDPAVFRYYSPLARYITSNREHLLPHNETFLTDTKCIGHRWLIPPYLDFERRTPIKRYFNNLHYQAKSDVTYVCEVFKRRFKVLQLFPIKNYKLYCDLFQAACYIHNRIVGCGEEIMVRTWRNDNVSFDFENYDDDLDESNDTDNAYEIGDYLNNSDDEQNEDHDDYNDQEDGEEQQGDDEQQGDEDSVHREDPEEEKHKNEENEDEEDLNEEYDAEDDDEDGIEYAKNSDENEEKDNNRVYTDRDEKNFAQLALCKIYSRDLRVRDQMALEMWHLRNPYLVHISHR